MGFDGMKRVKVDVARIGKYRRHAEKSRNIPVFFGAQMLDVIDLLMPALLLAEASANFIAWVDSDFDRDQAYVDEYYKRLEEMRKHVKNFQLVSPS